MALESSGTILHVAKISYQSDKWFGNCWGGPKLYTDTHTHRERERERDTHTHTHTDTQTQTHTHTHRGPLYKSCFSAEMQKHD